MNAPDDLWALIDIDGTVADYDASLRVEMNLILSPDEPLYMHRTGETEPAYLEARRKLIQRQPGFWRNLAPLPLGFNVVDELRSLGFSLHVLTKGPTSTSSAWGEKLEWCRQHLPDAIVTVTGDKSFVYGRVLVDDYPPYFERWRRVRPRGLVVCVAHPWNEDFAVGGVNERPNVFRYDGSNRDELRRRLALAYERTGGEA